GRRRSWLVDAPGRPGRRRPVAGAPGAGGRPPMTDQAPTLTGARVTLRPAGPDDADRFREILNEPSVARWWGAPRPGVDVALDWLDADDDTTVFAIEVDGTVVGSIQTAEEAEPDYRHASIDLFLA